MDDLKSAGTDAALIARLREGALYSCLNNQKLAEQTDRWLAADRIAAQAARIAELERQVKELDEQDYEECRSWQRTAESLERELAQARADVATLMRDGAAAIARAEANAKDAERYRWLREQSGIRNANLCWLGRREVLDGCIDAAIAQSKEGAVDDA